MIIHHPSRLACFLVSTTAASALAVRTAADAFGSGANQFEIGFTTIGNPGNAPDPTGQPRPAGSVDYVYRIGTCEITRGMITKANAPLAVGGGNLGLTMYDMWNFGGNGASRPATGLTWYEAAKFVNWLNTSTGHQRAYNLSGASLSLWSPEDAWQAGGQNPYRHKGAYYFLPGEHEWYKAAYAGRTDLYFNYPTGSDTAPTAVAGGTGAGTAVYAQAAQSGPADVFSAGGLSPHGTLGQGGNAAEWLESAYDGVNSAGSETRTVRGGNWMVTAGYLAASNRSYYSPDGESFDLGFRVAAVPEPVAFASLLATVALGLGRWCRHAPHRPSPEGDRPHPGWGGR